MADKDPTLERIGVSAIEVIFLNEFGWLFREQAVSDYGVDAQVEVVENNEPTGKLIALQIKTGASYFRPKGSDFVFYGELRHLDYWSRHSLPVFLVLHDPERKLTLWQKVERRLANVTDKGWSIMVPAGNVLDASAKTFIADGIASDDQSIRRFNMAFDLDTMEMLNDREVYFEVNEWVNKSLAIPSAMNVLAEASSTFPAGTMIDHPLSVTLARRRSTFCQRVSFLSGSCSTKNTGRE